MRTFTTVLKWVVGVGLVLALVMGGAGVFLYPQIKKMVHQMQAGETGTPVRTERVERGRLVRTVSAPGQVQPKTKVSISARVAAQILELPYREGDRVREGDVVVRLEDRDLQASVDSAQASLEAEQARLEGARASYVNAVAEWERQKSLFGSNDVSKSLMESAEAEMRRQESNLQASEHSIDVARARLDQSKENLKYATIVSPINGRVTKLNAEVGELVVTGTMNNAGTVIMEIADLSEMLVKAEVSESDVAPVKPGQPTRVYVNAYPGKVFEGVVQKVALQNSLARDGTKYFETEILLKLPEEMTLYRGLTANVDIEVEAIEGVVLAPSQSVVDMRVDELPAGAAASALVDREKTFARIVYKYTDNKVVATTVEVGASDLTKTVVLAGLDDGDEIVTGPWATIKNLKDGERVHRIEDAVKPGEAKQGLAKADDAKAASPEGKAPEKSSEADNGKNAPAAGQSTAKDGKKSEGAAATAANNAS